jgi:hypothetical protein
MPRAAACLWCEVERSSAARLNPGEPRRCPCCDHIFRGNGWDGIDAHWKAKHEETHGRYEEMWAGILACPWHHR